jgi:hypothetical protein
MPCQRCGARQGDPSRGPSAWRRAVTGGEQVLMCPTCQQDAGWQDGMDHCPACDGVRLSKTLGVLRCSGCGWSAEASVRESLTIRASPPPESLPAADEKLANEVRAALGRVFRSPAKLDP